MRAVLLAVAAAAVATLNAQDLPQASPKGMVEQVVGLTTITVKYSRPSVKERVIFGDLVPMDKVWRTGANFNSTIELSGPVKVGGVDVAAGKYSLFTVPGKDIWVVHLNRNSSLWGEAEFKEDENVASLKIAPSPCEFTETLTFDFTGLKGDNADLELRWEKTRLVIPIATDATEQGIANIKEALAKPDVKFGAYNSSARFYLDRNIDPKQALVWAKQSVEMEQKFWNMHTLARAQAANGLRNDAIGSAEVGMKLAQADGNEAYVSMLRGLIEELSKSEKK